MSLQRVPSIWRYVGLLALVVYFYSFGTFMSRMLTVNPSSLDPRYVTESPYLSTRLFANTPSNDDPKSTQHPKQYADSLRTSTRIQVPGGTRTSIAAVPGLFNRSVVAKSKPEVRIGRPEVVESDPAEFRVDVKLREVFDQMKNAAIMKKNVISGSSDDVTSRDLPPPRRRSEWAEEMTGNDSDHVINPHPFKYLINPETLCDAGESSDSIFIVVYVHTAPTHYKRRMVIRQTWGDNKQYPVDIRVVFFTGSPASQGIQKALDFEAEQYGDIVQEDFIDSYRNLTFKGVAALKWISNFCSRAKFVLKTDDDIFVNMFTLIRHLKRLEKQPHQVVKPPAPPSPIRHLLMCLVWNGMPVLRSGKWMVSKDDWKEDFYPTYCSGSAFVMSMDVAVDLHRVSYEVPFFWVDDLYITGLLPLKLGTIKHTQFMSVYLLNGQGLEERFTGPQWYKYIFCHVSDLSAILNVWKKVVAIQRGELVPTIQFLVPKTMPSPKPPPH